MQHKFQSLGTYSSICKFLTFLSAGHTIVVSMYTHFVRHIVLAMWCALAVSVALSKYLQTKSVAWNSNGKECVKTPVGPHHCTAQIGEL